MTDVCRRANEGIRQPPGDDRVWSGACSFTLHHILLVGRERLTKAGDAHINWGEDHVEGDALCDWGGDVVVA